MDTTLGAITRFDPAAVFVSWSFLRVRAGRVSTECAVRRREIARRRGETPSQLRHRCGRAGWWPTRVRLCSRSARLPSTYRCCTASSGIGGIGCWEAHSSQYALLWVCSTLVASPSDIVVETPATIRLKLFTIFQCEAYSVLISSPRESYATEWHKNVQ